jgi:hypothetical protein
MISVDSHFEAFGLASCKQKSIIGHLPGTEFPRAVGRSFHARGVLGLSQHGSHRQP